LASPALLDAIKIALLLGKPLLVTGEAGSGKTRLADFIRYRLALASPLLKFETKSTSDGRELFYSYNALARFQAAQTGSGSRRAADYIAYRALGTAYLRSWPYDAVRELLPATAERWDTPTRSVVLIDEIDKGSHDFPNDILNELEQRYFVIPEMGNARVACNDKDAPVVVLTSNSEKSLSDAFLRRCVYFHIPRLTLEMAREIAVRRIPRLAAARAGRFLQEGLELFFLFRGEALNAATKGGMSAAEFGLERKPGVAELLDWLVVLEALRIDDSQPLSSGGAGVLSSLPTLVKGGERDARKAEVAARKWLGLSAQAQTV
jgi:MoxR-like ATPase